MAISVNGILRSPTHEGIRATIRIVAKVSEGDTLSSSESVIISGDDGSYSFDLVNGIHSIEIKIDDEYFLNGTVQVDNQTSSPITLPGLIQNYSYTPPL